MSDKFPIEYAHLIAILIECILYGIYFVLFAACIYVLLYRPRENQINKTLLGVSFTLFILSTMHIAASIKLLFDAFIFDRNATGGPAATFAYEGDPINLFRKTTAALSILVGDGLVIHRCFTIWGRDYRIIILPVLCLVMTIISGSFVAKELVSQLSTVFSPALLTWVPIHFAFSFATNFIVTVLIAFRLWKAGRHVASLGPQHSRTYQRTLAIITESGAIYLIGNFIAIILFVLRLNTQAIPVNALTQLIAIAPTIIILQVQIGLSQARDSNRQATSWNIARPRLTSSHGMESSFGSPDTTPHPFSVAKPVVVTIERNVERDRQTMVGDHYGSWNEKVASGTPNAV